MRPVNQLTYDGYELIQFMLDAVRGEYPDANSTTANKPPATAQRRQQRPPAHPPTRNAVPQ